MHSDQGGFDSWSGTDQVRNWSTLVAVWVDMDGIKHVITGLGGG